MSDRDSICNSYNVFTCILNLIHILHLIRDSSFLATQVALHSDSTPIGHTLGRSVRVSNLHCFEACELVYQLLALNLLPGPCPVTLGSDLEHAMGNPSSPKPHLWPWARRVNRQRLATKVHYMYRK